jgi:hypothetical protein
MLANNLTQSIAHSRAVAVSVTAAAVHRLRRELAHFAFRFGFCRLRSTKRADLLDRANPNPVRLAQRAVHGPSFRYPHFGAVDKGGDIRWIRVAKSNEGSALTISLYGSFENVKSGSAQ